MNVLVFKTVNAERMNTLLNEIRLLQCQFYIIMPESEISIFINENTNIHYIGTNDAYMNYDTVMKENRIPNIMFHEIWILSFSREVLYSYTEVYRIISKLKYKRIIYKVINANKIMDYNINQEIIFSKFYYLIVNIIKVWTRLMYLFEKNIKGYKW